MRYTFKKIEHCQMCGDSTKNHSILGQRMNCSQGLSPSSKSGISVSIQKCNACQLIYSNPQPIPFDIQDHYGAPPESYWTEAYFEWKETYFKKPIEIAKSLLPFEPGMSALDIGAGIGKAMLSMEKAGFEVHGLEPSKPFHERAISKMNIKPEQLALSAIEEAEFAHEFFNFISFGAVFEHVYEPRECLEKAMKWLKPNGIIHLEVPSSNWLISSLINFYYRLRGTQYVTNISPMHAPYHMFEFGIKSFEEIAESLGFEIVYARNEVCTIPFFPKLTHPILKWYMKSSKRGLQYVIFLKKKGN